MERERPHRLVLGIGNPDRGDDAAGREVARLLHTQHSDDVEILELDGDATTLLDRLERASAAWIVDACHAGAVVGTVRRFDVSGSALPHARFGLSTHGMGLAEAIELARALQQLPRRCIVYTLEGNSFDTGAALSLPVAEAIRVVAARIAAELQGT